ncbi:MAG: hypothetical protein U0360_04340 [Dehalococcoidia bacterium]
MNNVHRPCGLTVGPDLQRLRRRAERRGTDGGRAGHRSPPERLLTRGRSSGGSGTPRRAASRDSSSQPHGVAVDVNGDVYVAEVSYTIRGRLMDPPRPLRSLTKLRRR